MIRKIIILMLFLSQTALGLEGFDTANKACPAPPFYFNLTPGQRLAGISPTCQAVQVPFNEMDEGLIDQNIESQQYQFNYGLARDPYHFLYMFERKPTY